MLIIRITPRQKEILELKSLGLTIYEIGAKLYISHRTVETHLNKINMKIKVKLCIAGRINKNACAFLYLRFPEIFEEYDAIVFPRKASLIKRYFQEKDISMEKRITKSNYARRKLVKPLRHRRRGRPRIHPLPFDYSNLLIPCYLG